MLLAIIVLFLLTPADAGSRVQQLVYTCGQEGQVTFVVSEKGNGTICGALFSPFSLVSCRDGKQGVVIYGGAVSQPPYIITPIIPSQGIDFIGGLSCTQTLTTTTGQCVDYEKGMGHYQSMLYLRKGELC